jgi:hypothetical protein
VEIAHRDASPARGPLHLDGCLERDQRDREVGGMAGIAVAEDGMQPVVAV